MSTLRSRLQARTAAVRARAKEHREAALLQRRAHEQRAIDYIVNIVRARAVDIEKYLEKCADEGHTQASLIYIHQPDVNDPRAISFSLACFYIDVSDLDALLVNKLCLVPRLQSELLRTLNAEFPDYAPLSMCADGDVCFFEINISWK